MDAYTSFAQVYDELMDNIPYDEWISYITSLLHEYNITEGLVELILKSKNPQLCELQSSLLHNVV